MIIFFHCWFMAWDCPAIFLLSVLRGMGSERLFYKRKQIHIASLGILRPEIFISECMVNLGQNNEVGGLLWEHSHSALLVSCHFFLQSHFPLTYPACIMLSGAPHENSTLKLSQVTILSWNSYSFILLLQVAFTDLIDLVALDMSN